MKIKQQKDFSKLSNTEFAKEVVAMIKGAANEIKECTTIEEAHDVAEKMLSAMI